MELSIFFKGSWKDFVAFCKSHALYRAPSHAFSKPAGPGDRTHFLNRINRKRSVGERPMLFRCSFCTGKKGGRSPRRSFSHFLKVVSSCSQGRQSFLIGKIMSTTPGQLGPSFRFFPVYGPFLGKAPFMKAAQKLQTVTFSWQKACF